MKSIEDVTLNDLDAAGFEMSLDYINLTSNKPDMKSDGGYTLKELTEMGYGLTAHHADGKVVRSACRAIDRGVRDPLEPVELTGTIDAVIGIVKKCEKIKKIGDGYLAVHKIDGYEFVFNLFDFGDDE